MAQGVVNKTVIDKGFGFIKGDDGVEYFFHRSSLERPSSFGSLVEGSTKVSFEPGDRGKGPRAETVVVLD